MWGWGWGSSMAGMGQSCTPLPPCLPMSFMMSANSLHCLALLSKLDPAAYAKMMPPAMPVMSRTNHCRGNSSSSRELVCSVRCQGGTGVMACLADNNFYIRDFTVCQLDVFDWPAVHAMMTETGLRPTVAPTWKTAPRAVAACKQHHNTPTTVTSGRLHLSTCQPGRCMYYLVLEPAPAQQCRCQGAHGVDMSRQSCCCAPGCQHPRP